MEYIAEVPSYYPTRVPHIPNDTNNVDANINVYISCGLDVYAHTVVGVNLSGNMDRSIDVNINVDMNVYENRKSYTPGPQKDNVRAPRSACHGVIRNTLR